MKKLIRKDGFTIVEVMVAFVIFSIMAAIVCSIVNQAMLAKQDNIELEGEIENQAVTYYGKTIDRTYDSADSDSLSFNFDKVSPLSISCSIGDPNASDADNQIAIEYFVGDVNYGAMYGKGSQSNPSKGDNDSGSVADRFQKTAIYGSNGITNIQMNIQRDTSYTGKGYRYFVASKAIGDKDEQYDMFKQYRLVFPGKLLSYGYANFNEPSKSYRITDSSANYKLEKTNIVTNNSTGETSSTIRISCAQSSLVDPLINQGFTAYYVVLDKELESVSSDLNLYEIFGVSSTNQNPKAKPVDNIYKFSQYVEETLDKDGKTVETTHVNVFAATEKTKSDDSSKDKAGQEENK